jgi:Adaptor complexes medium subunit family
MTATSLQLPISVTVNVSRTVLGELSINCSLTSNFKSRSFSTTSASEIRVQIPMHPNHVALQSARASLGSVSVNSATRLLEWRIKSFPSDGHVALFSGLCILHEREREVHWEHLPILIEYSLPFTASDMRVLSCKTSAGSRTVRIVPSNPLASEMLPVLLLGSCCCVICIAVIGAVAAGGWSLFGVLIGACCAVCCLRALVNHRNPLGWNDDQGFSEQRSTCAVSYRVLW